MHLAGIEQRFPILARISSPLQNFTVFKGFSFAILARVSAAAYSTAVEAEAIRLPVSG